MSLPIPLIEIVQRHSRIIGNTIAINCYTLTDAKQLIAHSAELAAWVLLNHRCATQVQINLHGAPLYPSFSPFIALPVLHQTKDPELLRIVDQVNSSELPVCLTDHTSHRCLLLSSHFEPERIVWNRLDFQKYVNFWDAWQVNPQRLIDLQQILRQQRRVDAFEFYIRRVDGRIAHCIKDFKLVQIAGRPVRVSRSHYWELLPVELPFDSR